MSREEEDCTGQSPNYNSRLVPDPTWCEHGRGECSCEDDGETAANPPASIARPS